MICSLEDEKWRNISKNEIENKNIKIKITDYGAGLSE
jgi:hypothetical protein